MIAALFHRLGQALEICRRIQPRGRILDAAKIGAKAYAIFSPAFQNILNMIKDIVNIGVAPAQKFIVKIEL